MNKEYVRYIPNALKNNHAKFGAIWNVAHVCLYCGTRWTYMWHTLDKPALDSSYSHLATFNHNLIPLLVLTHTLFALDPSGEPHLSTGC